MLRIDYIREKLSYIKSIVEDDNKQKLYNINKTAEDIFMYILNDVYDLKLVNANNIKSNFPAIDLIDNTNKIVFQVTSEISSTKLLNTIKKFKTLVEKKEYNKYSTYEINIFYIKNKPNFQNKTLKLLKNNSILESNLLSIEDINNEVRANPDIAQKVFKTLTKIFYDTSTSFIKNPNLTIKSSTLDSNFIGREYDIKNIDDILLTSTTVLLINGIGGIGKSSLVNYYLNTREKKFDYYGFIDGFSNFISEFRNSLNLKSEKEEDLNREVIYKLQKIKGKKLLIIDNVEDIKENTEIIDMISSLVKYDYKIILTSRINTKRFNTYHLDTLFHFDAQKLFLLYYKTNEIEKVDKIIDYLGLHTLFIKLIAETVENNEYSLDNIISKFKNGELSKIEFIDEESGEELTLNYNLQELFSMQNIDNEYISLLKQLSILSSINIEIELLENILSKRNLKGKLNFLVNCGWLIKTNKTYKLHQIIKEYILSSTNIKFEVVEVVLDNFLKLIEDTTNSQVAVKNKKHLIHLDSLIKSFSKLGIENRKIAILLSNIGHIYHCLGVYKKAEFFYLKNLNMSKKIFCNENSEMATSYSNLASIYEEIGKYQEAKSLYLKALHLRKKIFGINNSNTAQSYAHLAGLYASLGEYKKAEFFYLKGINIETKFGNKDNDTIYIYYNNLAGLYRLMGKYQKAEFIYLKSIKIIRKIYKVDNYHITPLYANLSLIYQLTREYQKAEYLIYKAIKIDKELFGEEHFKVVFSYASLAHIYRLMGLFEKSEFFYMKTQILANKIFIEKHPFFITLYNNLGLLYSDMKQYESVERFLLKALNLTIKMLGEKHPETATIYYNLAHFYYDYNKDLRKAYYFISKSVEIRAKCLLPQHNDLINAKNDLNYIKLQINIMEGNNDKNK